MITKKYNKVNFETVGKLLVRCKWLLSSRHLLYKTIRALLLFEKNSKQIRKEIDVHLDDNINGAEEDVDRLKSQVAKLPVLAKQVVDNIAILRDNFRLFNAVVALTSNGN